MSININLELELNEITGPYTLGTVEGGTPKNFYVLTNNKTLGVLSGAVVQLTDYTLNVAIFNGGYISARNTLEALVIQGVLEDLLKEAGSSTQANLVGLYTDGYVNITPDESDLIKTLLRGKRDSLLKQY